MAHNPIFGSDPVKPVSSTAEGMAENDAAGRATRVGESDLADLAAQLAAHGGGRVSPELSADLALEILLNEIVEEARVATGASGAAIVLERGGEWVCRATAGSNAPHLGARLDTASGLSGACVNTRTAQRCDDAQTDPRADIEACRILGVRSVTVLPLLQNGELVGVFEVFSTWPSAFGERDEHTLEALWQRVLSNLEQGYGAITMTMSAAAELSSGAPSIAEDLMAAADGRDVSLDMRSLDLLLAQPASAAPSGRGMNLMTWALGAVLLAYAVLLTVLVSQRLSGGKATAHVRPPAAVATPSTGVESQAAGVSGTGTSVAASDAASGAGGNQSAGSNSGTPRSGTSSAAPAAAARHATALPPSSLLVFENGKEVFRMKPTPEHAAEHIPESGEATGSGATNRTDVTSGRGTQVQGASAAESAGVLELPAEVAEGSLLHRVEPDYPEAARQQQIEGGVVMEVHIGQDGSVQEVTVVSGPPLLAQAATAAVKQWRFKPRVVSGRPAEIRTRIILNFRLPR
jgi:TonB family protein